MIPQLGAQRLAVVEHRPYGGHEAPAQAAVPLLDVGGAEAGVDEDQAVGPLEEQHVGDHGRGQRRLALLARALASRPKLLLGDDLITDAEAKSPTERENRWTWLTKAIDYLGPPDGSVKYCGVGTILVVGLVMLVWPQLAKIGPLHTLKPQDPKPG